ncbi:hypothetical protein HXX76_002884 [Chlamydomonas incerta]|uniref:CNNM transmembrane domain-containing protein n=1 Tax=Chlamydomonas incerta TaxID=51695 RepID=A0A835TRA9_CHLIN|nr:hypothetical protein HXX76_002884 [Chlamydomonas incerta]|eukprot:KAG2442805.1 hypothetical protein HXX76_002884 [Chlamydomonas incerta]
MSGLMSGLTLGLMSLDSVELEVLLRSGTPKEQKYARKIMPLIKSGHHLLVTLLLCNAMAMEALPLFLDKLATPFIAVAISVTAVLFFGEIIPQSVCSRYGLRIGAHLSPLVRALMWLCTPVAWPLAKLLDKLLGPDHHTLFRRRQLKELVSIHAEDAGMGGALTRDEIKVITGALDLTAKVAYRAMTPLDKVFMLSASDSLDEATLLGVLRSGHSRIPVHAAHDRGDVVGLVLVKELLQYRLGSSGPVPVGMLRMRSIPRLPATTPMYDMLRLFQTGRSHIAVLTQPPPGELQRRLALDQSQVGVRAASRQPRKSAAVGGGGAAGASGTAAGASVMGSAWAPSVYGMGAGAGGAGAGGGPSGMLGGYSLGGDSVAATADGSGSGVRRVGGPGGGGGAAEGGATCGAGAAGGGGGGGGGDGSAGGGLTLGLDRGLSGGYSVMDDTRSVAGETEGGYGDGDSVYTLPYSLHHAGSGGPGDLGAGGGGGGAGGGGAPSYPPSMLDPTESYNPGELSMGGGGGGGGGQRRSYYGGAGELSAAGEACGPELLSPSAEAAEAHGSAEAGGRRGRSSAEGSGRAGQSPSPEPGVSRPLPPRPPPPAPSSGAAGLSSGPGGPASSRDPSAHSTHPGTAPSAATAGALAAAPSAPRQVGSGHSRRTRLGREAGQPGAYTPPGALTPASVSPGMEEPSVLSGGGGDGGGGGDASARGASARTSGYGEGGGGGAGAGGGEADAAAAEAEAAFDAVAEAEAAEAAAEGRPIGIITIEDVIEELIRTEIVDETDRYVDNDRRIRANPAKLARELPEHLAKVLAAASVQRKAAALQRAMSFGGGGGGGLGALGRDGGGGGGGGGAGGGGGGLGGFGGREDSWMGGDALAGGGMARARQRIAAWQQQSSAAAGLGGLGGGGLGVAPGSPRDSFVSNALRVPLLQTGDY